MRRAGAGEATSFSGNDLNARFLGIALWTDPTPLRECAFRLRVLAVSTSRDCTTASHPSCTTHSSDPPSRAPTLPSLPYSPPPAIRPPVASCPGQRGRSAAGPGQGAAGSRCAHGPCRPRSGRRHPAPCKHVRPAPVCGGLLKGRHGPVPHIRLAARAPAALRPRAPATSTHAAPRRAAAPTPAQARCW